ncbi:hypothetical protein TSOC_012383, partial [Tetrabaena socialis]
PADRRRRSRSRSHDRGRPVVELSQPERAWAQCLYGWLQKRSGEARLGELQSSQAIPRSYLERHQCGPLDFLRKFPYLFHLQPAFPRVLNSIIQLVPPNSHYGGGGGRHPGREWGGPWGWEGPPGRDARPWSGGGGSGGPGAGEARDGLEGGRVEGAAQYLRRLHAFLVSRLPEAVPAS